MAITNVKISGRDDMIRLGEVIGEHLKERHKWGGQTVITGHGAVNCGKSLLALSLDRCFRPFIYEDGLDPSKSVDDLLVKKDGAAQPPVTFKNFDGKIHKTLADYNQALGDYVRQNRTAKVLFASNVLLQLSKSFYDVADPLQTSQSDIDMEFDTNPGNPLDSTIRITHRDVALDRKLTLANLVI